MKALTLYGEIMEVLNRQKESGRLMFFKNQLQSMELLTQQILEVVGEYYNIPKPDGDEHRQVFCRHEPPNVEVKFDETSDKPKRQYFEIIENPNKTVYAMADFMEVNERTGQVYLYRYDDPDDTRDRPRLYMVFTLGVTVYTMDKEAFDKIINRCQQ